MSLSKKIRKIGHFVGPTRFDGPPVLVNSMPKAGTNLFEGFLVALGYKRHPARCLNETNIGKVRLRPGRGRFYIAHLAEDKLFSTEGQVTFLITRPLWGCIKSYVNFMYIEAAHPVSQFVRRNQLESALDRLLFTDDNPNGRPLVDEYLRFARLDLSRFDQVIGFEALIARDPELVLGLSQHLGATRNQIEIALSNALKEDSYTKNLGRIDLFSTLSPERLSEVKAKVEARESAAFGTTS